MTVHQFKQPDDPGPSHGICPECGCRCKRDPDQVALNLLKRNASRVDKHIIAMALSWSVGKLERFARKNKIDLVCREREAEPTGA